MTIQSDGMRVKPKRAGVMRRSALLVCALPIMVACDPVMISRLRLMPTVARTDSARSDTASQSTITLRGEAIAAVERLARRFGLESTKPKGCDRNWQMGVRARTDSERPHGTLTICAELPLDGSVEIRLIEGPTTAWSPKADSLRRALADTLKQFGAIKIP